MCECVCVCVCVLLYYVSVCGRSVVSVLTMSWLLGHIYLLLAVKSFVLFCVLAKGSVVVWIPGIAFTI